MRAIGLLIMLCCSSWVHAQTIYRWVDEHGITHYGSHPPPAETSASGDTPDAGALGRRNRLPAVSASPADRPVTAAPSLPPLRVPDDTTLLERLAAGDPAIDRTLLENRQRTGRQLVGLLNARYGTAIPDVETPGGIPGPVNSHCYYSLPFQLIDLLRYAYRLHRPGDGSPSARDQAQTRTRLNRLVDRMATGAAVHGACIEREPVERLLADLVVSLQQGEQAQRAWEAEQQRHQVEAAARAETERQTAAAAEQQRQRQAQQALQERRRALQPGEVEAGDWHDARLRYDAGDGRLLLYRPPVIPDQRVYLLRNVLLERREADGLLIINGGSDTQPHHGAVRITPDTRLLDQASRAFNFPLTVIGRHVDPLEYRTVLGARRTMPVFEALWVQP